MFVERDRNALRALDENLDALDLRDRSKVVAADAVSAAATIDADIVFADPPYDFDDWALLLGRVRSDLVVAESGSSIGPIDGWEATREKRYGRTRVTFLERRVTQRCRVCIPMTTRTDATAGAVSRQLRSDPPRPRRHHRTGARAVRFGRGRRDAQSGEAVGAVPRRRARRTAHGRRWPISTASPLWPRPASPCRRPQRADVDFIVKGLRTPGDFEIEQQMAHNNYAVTGIRTVYLPCRPELGYISSRFVREIAKYGGAIDHLVPAPIADALRRTFDGDQN